jgi:cytoskeletal protein RodZ
MQTVGQILRETREEKMLSLEEVEKAIKIRKELLEALESDNYKKLPPPTFVQGFIKNYASYLELDSAKLLAIFRRGFEDERYPAYVMDAFSNPLKTRKVQITPAKVLGIVIGLTIVAFFGYLWLQYHQFTAAPTLNIVSPADQITTDNPGVIVEGHTDPENKVAINDQLIPVGQNGEFRQQLTLSAQVNKIMVEATNKFGQKTQAERTVYLKR